MISIRTYPEADQVPECLRLARVEDFSSIGSRLTLKMCDPEEIPDYNCRLRMPSCRAAAVHAGTTTMTSVGLEVTSTVLRSGNRSIANNGFSLFITNAGVSNAATAFSRNFVQGPLAQFSRSELVRSLAAQMVREFGRNVESLSAGPVIPA